MNPQRIALLSMACRFPEAGSPDALWQNVLEGRRSFRPIPSERLSLADYDAAVVGDVDSIPNIPAGLISDWSFSRADFRIPKSTFDTTDLTHWLALETAAKAIADIGGADVLPRARTAVILGDTLTGEFSRSAQMRLRAPYLARHLSQVLAINGSDEKAAQDIVAQFVANISADFPDPNEETLAGALANTIAGRIANHFDLHGGAWTVDGACASSLLAVADGCTRLVAGDVDVAIVGGVDLSLDPFELVGFARAGALAKDQMRVFDKRAAGFWPGEGCGVFVLATQSAAKKIGGTPLAWIDGWGTSTDGAGGLTRPTISGQALALERAWSRAQRAPHSAGLFEAHGTGTTIGDHTEISALAQVLGPTAQRIPVGSIKANIGHCKAAAGAASLVKLVSALRDGIIPPHVSCDDLNPVFDDTGNRLHPAHASEWSGPRVGGLSGFGFGGVNTHVVLSQAANHTSAAPKSLRPQDAELFVFGEQTQDTLIATLKALHARAGTFSLAELTDAAAKAAHHADIDAPYRAAIVAGNPSTLRTAIVKELDRLKTPQPALKEPAKIGFLFPGQAAPVRTSASTWGKRFPEACDAFAWTQFAKGTDLLQTHIAQPAIVAASLSGLQVMTQLGIKASAALGHSLGEISALSWAGGLDPRDCHRLAFTRGRIMFEHGQTGGTMARLDANADTAKHVAAEYNLTIACINTETETVLAGAQPDMDRMLAAHKGAPLAVSHAFHSPHMCPAQNPFAAALVGFDLKPPTAPVVSSVTGEWITQDDDVHSVLVQQLTAPVRFTQALETLAQNTDVLIEVGPGTGLTRLAQAAGHTCIALDVGGSSLRPLLDALALIWKHGGQMTPTALFHDRPTRPLSAKAPALLHNPCGIHPTQTAPPVALRQSQPKTSKPVVQVAEGNVLEVVLDSVAEELGLPVETLDPDARLLDDLHLNSLSVGRIVAAAAAALGMGTSVFATDLVQFSSADLAAHLAEMRDLAPAASATEPLRIEGVAPWVASFETHWQAAPEHPPTQPMPIWAAFGAPMPLDFAGNLKEATHGLIALNGEAPNSTTTAQTLWRYVQQAHAAKLRNIAILHHGSGVDGFARSLLAEQAFDSIACIDISDAPQAWGCVQSILSTIQNGFTSHRISAENKILRPVLERCAPHQAAAVSLEGKVALVVGGARGIGAECALRLGTQYGMTLALIGRSPETSQDVQNTLQRAQALGIKAHYLSVDASDAQAMAKAVAVLGQKGLYPHTAIHAAGINQPDLFDKISPETLDATLNPKLMGLHALCAALDPKTTDLVVGFGSIIGALGLAGETHYALANGMMCNQLTQWSDANGVRALSLDWSVWAGAGMGERLGAVEGLSAHGVDAIPLTSALDSFSKLVGDQTVQGRRIVTSRFGPPPNVDFQELQSPPLRFVEHVRLHTPKVELIAEAKLSPGADPWLDDHTLDGVRIVPGVMLMEAAAQMTRVLTGQTASGFSHVSFERPVTVPDDGNTLRSCALLNEDQSIDIALRASDDNYATDRARLRVHTNSSDMAVNPPIDLQSRMQNNAAPLYEKLFFNSGRFARLVRLGHVSAFAVQAQLASDQCPQWFGAFAAQQLILGDPGARDAGLHLLQTCAPQFRVLPVSVAQISVIDVGAERAFVEAYETWSDGQSFEFDIIWRDQTGACVEHWHKALFRSIAPRAISDLSAFLMPAALERATACVTRQKGIRVSLNTSDANIKTNRLDRRVAILNNLGLQPPTRRNDGAPELSNGKNLSLAHTTNASIGATASHVLGIDLVDTHETPSLQNADQDLATAVQAYTAWGTAQAQRAIWAAREALRKAGAPATSVLSLDDGPRIGGVVLNGGGFRVICLAYDGVGCVAIAVPVAPAITAKNAKPAISEYATT